MHVRNIANRVRGFISILPSIVALIVFMFPWLLGAIWISTIVASGDPRNVRPTAVFYPRSVDETTSPLQPFHEPIISVTCDDGWESVYTVGFPLFQKYGFHTTQYIITNTMDDPSYNYMSLAQLRAMHAAGTEIASHTMSHPDLTTLDVPTLKRELGTSQAILQQDFNAPVLDFASPLGAYNTYTLQYIAQYYQSQKNAEGDPAANDLEAINTTSNFNPLNFISYSIRNTTTLDDIQHLLTTTEDNNGWLVLTYHQIDTSGEEFSVTPDEFSKQMSMLSKAPIRSATVEQVMAQLLPRRQ